MQMCDTLSYSFLSIIVFDPLIEQGGSKQVAMEVFIKISEIE
jgi:hypothetical protein